MDAAYELINEIIQSENNNGIPTNRIVIGKNVKQFVKRHWSIKKYVFEDSRLQSTRVDHLKPRLQSYS